MTVTNRPEPRAAAPLDDPVRALRDRFWDNILTRQETHEDFPLLWITPQAAPDIQRFLKDEIDRPYALMTDLWGIDETARTHRDGQPPWDITVATHLFSPDRNSDIRLKIACDADTPRLPTLTGVNSGADRFRREAFDMFGVHFNGRDSHHRILMPNNWQGHPCAKRITPAPLKPRRSA